jgi:hypothetical protein
MSERRPEIPGKRLSRLQRLKARQLRWREKRAARRALFTRPTPVANHLLAVASAHRLIDFFYVALSILIGLRFIWLLAGHDQSSPFYEALVLLTLSFLQPIDAWMPPFRINGDHWFAPGAIVALALYAVVCKLLHRLLHFLAYRNPLRPRGEGR